MNILMEEMINMSKNLLKKFNIFILIFGIVLGVMLFIFAHYYIEGNIVNSIELSVGGFILPVINLVAQL